MDAAPLPASAKSPGATHCYNQICHRVLSLSETAARIGRIESVVASHYGAPGTDRFNPRSETSSGEMFDPTRDHTIASPIYPDGTRLVLWNPATGHAASVRVTNAGPYMGRRTVDASEQLARRLGFYHVGVARLQTVVIASPTPDEAVYRRGRVYPRVPGYLGRFSSLETALLADSLGAEAALAHSGSSAETTVQYSTPAATAVAGFRQVLARPSRVAARVVKAPRKRAAPATPQRPAAPVEHRSAGHCVFNRDPVCS